MTTTEKIEKSETSMLRRADDALFRAEKSLVSVFLIAMTTMVFVDVIHRRLIAPDSRIGRLLASMAGVAADSPERAFYDGTLAPIVGSVVGIALAWAGFATAERHLGKKLLAVPASALVLALASAAGVGVFCAMLLWLESRDVYLALYAIAAGLYIRHLVITKPEGWTRQVGAIALVLTPGFVWLAFNHFPEAYTWGKELSMLMVLWVGFFGASICVHEGKHIRLEALERTWPEPARRAMRLVAALGAAAFCLFLAWLGYRYVFAQPTGIYWNDTRLQETGIPDWVMTVSIPLAFLLTSLRLIASGVSAWQGGDYGVAAKAEGMEEAEKIAAERGGAKVEVDPEAEKKATKRRGYVFWGVVGAAVIAPFAFGKGGILLSAILIAAMLSEPLFVILGVVTILCFLLWSDDIRRPEDFSILVERIRGLADNKALLSVPFYVMSGAVMGYGQIGRRLVDFSNAIFGWLPGGLAISVVFGCILFSAISGSSPATVIAIGSVMGPALIAHGYRKDFSIGLVTAAGSLGILIPPSIPMIVYCIVNTTTVISVEEFHAAGFMPGFVIGGVLAVYCIYRGVVDKTPRDPFSLEKLWIATRDGIWSLLFPVLILGGIYLGFFDDVEAACTSVVYAVIVEVYVHRAFKLGDVPKVFMEVGVLLGSFLVVLVVAMSFGEFLTVQGVPQLAADEIQAMNLEPWQFLLVMNLMLLVVGCLMDIMSAMFIFVPLLAPMAAAMGIDPIHLGIVFIVNLEIGYLLPPMGLNLYVSSTLFSQPITFVMRSVVPFIFVMIVGLLMITYIPSLTLDSAAWVMSIARDEEPSAPGEGGEGEEGGGGGGGLEGVMTLEEMMNASETDEDEDEPLDVPDEGDLVEEPAPEAPEVEGETPVEGDAPTDEGDAPSDDHAETARDPGTAPTVP